MGAERPGALARFLGSTGFKLAVAAAIIALLLGSERLDASALLALRDTWPWLLLAFLLMLPPYFIVSVRFAVVLRSQEIPAPFGLAVRWTMIGSFFDLAMPSSNGGDVLKAGLVARHFGAGMRTRAVMAVAFDRVLGLVGLFLLASLVGIAGWGFLREVKGHAALLAAAFGGSVGVLVAFRVLGARRLYNSAWLGRIFARGGAGDLLRKLVRAFNDLRERPALLAAALALSVLNHVFWCASLLCIARALGNDVPALAGFVVLPMAIFSNIFGFAGGFGLGTAGFDVLLALFLGIHNGALIGLVFQALQAASKLLGLPWFLTRGEQPLEDSAPRG